jgi:hypothetical protein
METHRRSTRYRQGSFAQHHRRQWAWSRNYGRGFGIWIKQHGFDQMPAPTRSVAIELYESAPAGWAIMAKRRNPFQGLNLPRRASINPLGGKARSVPVSLPKLRFLGETTDDDDGKCRVTTEPSSA